MRARDVWSNPLMMCAVTAFGLAACSDPAIDDATPGSGLSDDPPGSEAVTQPIDDADRTAIIEPIHFIGRFDMTDPKAPVFEWSGSAIWTRFFGTTISVELDGSANDFEVEIDGVRQPVITHPGGDHTYVLASGLSRRLHDVKLTRRTEAFFSTSVFRGFRGALLIPTPRPTRLIEMIGDSITCGYGITGVGPGCHFSHDTEAETHAWGALTAAQLGATHHAICWSGIGVSRNFNDQPGALMPERYGFIAPNESAGAWQFRPTPQVVVINLGTNDFSVGVDPGQNFVDAMTAFVRQVRSHYRSTPIVLATSPMLGGTQHTTEKAYLDAVAMTDARTVVLDLAEQQASDGFGCDFHPSEITAQKMADRLEQQLHSLLGW
jgi:lysophospholipase L1-like esterase